MPYKHVDAAAEMVQVAQANSCGTMVVGVPLTPRGTLADRDTDSQVGRRCRNFAHTLAMVGKPHGISVYIVSERYSTMEAEDLLIQNKRSKRAAKVTSWTLFWHGVGCPCNLIVYSLQERLDAISAVVILERFFRDKEAAVEVTSTFGLKPSSA